jgi:GSH-dependent disulfide-bond oxidoreductase
MTLQFYTWSTPNGRKVSIMMEELALNYDAHPINILQHEQFTPAFQKLNINGKIPVLVDPDGPGGRPLTLAESGAILVYLGEKYPSRLWPSDVGERAMVLQWLMFQMGGIGPMFGQLHHFRRYATEEIYALERYSKEVRRLYGVLNRRLAENQFVAGDCYTIADIATYPWIARFELHGLTWDEAPNVKRWFDAVGARAAVVRGMAVPAAV